MPSNLKRLSPKPWLIAGFVLLLVAPVLAHLSNAGLIHLNMSQTTEDVIKNISHIGGFVVLLVGVILIIRKTKVKG